MSREIAVPILPPQSEALEGVVVHSKDGRRFQFVRRLTEEEVAEERRRDPERFDRELDRSTRLIFDKSLGGVVWWWAKEL